MMCGMTREPLVAALSAAGCAPGRMLGLAVTGGPPDPVGKRRVRRAAVAFAEDTWLVQDPADLAAVEQALAPRWVWWATTDTAAPLLADGVQLAQCWDLASVHRLLEGGWAADPAAVWARAVGLDPARIPAEGQLDLLDPSGPSTGRALSGPTDRDDPRGPDGYLRPGAGTLSWLADGDSDVRLARWARLGLQVQAAQERELSDRQSGAGRFGDRRTTARSESAAALLAVELERAGLPVDRAEAERIIGSIVGPRPASEADRLAQRRRRDQAVLAHARGADADLRNPAQVKALLARVGVDLPDTRSWRLLPLRDVHPLVRELLAWRKAERVDTTYGYAWLDRQVHPDGRLRGQWQASDGAAGRMTAQAGLHNLPAELRPCVRATPGHRLVRADLGQIEPRVLAAVSGDPALAAAARQADLYAPVAEQLRVDRPTAKVAVLAAMYGQTSGAAGQALRGMDAAYPVAMAYLRAADEAGRAGRGVTTYGGRRVPVWPLAAGLDEHQQRSAAAARGRFTRNAVVQGAAAELFKAWAVTVRQTGRAAGATIVLCLHDELLLEAPQDRADEVAAGLVRALEETARRWFPPPPVRFVADVRVIERWSDAKD